MSRYPKTTNNPDFPELEQRVLKRWAEENTFRRSVEQRPRESRVESRESSDVLHPKEEGNEGHESGLGSPSSPEHVDDIKNEQGGELSLVAEGVRLNEKASKLSQEQKITNNEWVFYDGPPFANGLPHYGHLLTSCVKDIFARYHTMKGERVERRFGWDCHGLPAEMGAEKELGVSGRKAIEDFGIDKFNEHCRTSVMQYTNVWQDYINRAARWVDFENDYKTMDTDYMESVLWAFKQLYDKGLVYESHRVMPYSWGAETPLSNFETRMDDAYRERTDKAVTVAFELEEAPRGAPDADKYFLLAWTTTPWTLPSNLALAVGEEMEYVCVVQERSPLADEKEHPPLQAGGVGGGAYTTRTKDP